MICVKENIFFDPTLGVILHLHAGQNEVPAHIHLDAKLANLFHLLLLQKGKLISRQTFVDEVWEGNVWVGEKALTRNISRLRTLLKEHGLDQSCSIKTHPKKGYSMVIHTEARQALSVTRVGVSSTRSIWLGLGLVLIVTLLSSLFILRVEDIEEHQVILQDPNGSPIFEEIITQD